MTITKHGKAVALLVPIKQKGRPMGMDRGKIWIAHDFDAPLPDDLLKEFYGGELPEIVEPPKKK